MKEYALGLLAGVWLADGASLLIAPRAVMNWVREVIVKTPDVFRWQILGIAAGVALFALGLDLAYQPLWVITALGMIAKGLFLWLGPAKLRKRIL